MSTCILKSTVSSFLIIKKKKLLQGTCHVMADCVFVLCYVRVQKYTLPLYYSYFKMPSTRKCVFVMFMSPEMSDLDNTTCI